MQSNVDISTNEADLNITYGIIDFGVEREAARTSVKYLLTDVNDIQRSYIRLGFHLSEFSRLGFYKDFGFSSLADFCEVNLGLDKSAVSRCISVFDVFAKRNGMYSDGSRTMFINEKYQDFSYSQLCEMVSMSDEERKLVKPEMTIKQIRELKKKNVSRKEENVSQVATSQQDGFFDYKTFVNKKGKVKQNYIKKLNSVKTDILYVFDKDGKEVIGNLWVDVLHFKENKIVIRLPDSADTTVNKNVFSSESDS